MKKIITVFILILIFSFGCSRKNKKNPSSVSWIKFEWEGDTIGNRYYDKLAMFVPFKISGIPYKFTSQLDLGAPMTMIYGNSFTPLLDKFPKISSKLDTINKKYVIQGRKTGEFKNITFFLDTVAFNNQEIAFFEGFGETFSLNDFKNDTVLHIGTIGSNLFKNKILAIDFKEKRFALLDTLRNNTEQQLTDIVIEKGRIKIPVIINGKKVFVLYDTGTSFATLYLSTKNWDEYRDTTSHIDSLMANAWGTKYTLYISKTNIEIKVGNNIFKPETIMANSLEPYYEFYQKENIIGLMGNKLFYDKILVIDFKHNKLGIFDDNQIF